MSSYFHSVNVIDDLSDIPEQVSKIAEAIKGRGVVVNIYLTYNDGRQEVAESILSEVSKYNEGQVAISVIKVHECGIIGKGKAQGVWTATIINS